MERNTKILIGLAAAGVVAYLVLKPKNAKNSTSTVPNSKPIESGTYDKPNPNDMADLLKYRQTCGDGYRTNNPEVDCKTRGGYNTGVVAPIKLPSQQNNPIFSNCQCIMAPCNCGGGGANPSGLGAILMTAEM